MGSDSIKVSSLIFLSTSEQLDLLYTKRPDLLNTTYLVSLDLDVSSRLRKLGYSFNELTDFVSASDIQSIFPQMLDFVDHWYESLKAEAEFEGIHPLDMERKSLSYFFRDALFAVRLFESAHAQLEFKEIILFPNLHEPFMYSTPSPDTRTAVWSYMADQRQINKHLIPVEMSIGKATRFWEKAQLALRIILKSASNPLLSKVLLPRLKRSSQKPILFIVAINEAHRYAYVAKELQTALGKRFMPFVLGARRHGSLVIPQYDFVYHPFGLIPGISFFKARHYANGLYSRWETGQDKYKQQFPEIFANPHLQFQFAYYFRVHLTNSIENFMQAKTIIERLRPALVVTTPNANVYQTTVIEAARVLGIPSAVVPHSATPEGKHLLVRAEHAIVWSNDFIQQWRYVGMPEERIHVIGVPRTLVDDGYRQSDQKPESVSNEKVILVLLVQANEAALPIVDFEQHVKTLRNLLRIPEHLRGKVKLLLKLHPIHDYQFLYQEISASGVEILKEAKLAHLVKTTDVTVLVNVPTSAYLMPLYEQKPLLCIRTTDVIETIFDFAHHGGKAVITQDEDVWPMLEQVLFVPAAAEEILAANEAYLSQIMPVTDDPIQNLKEVIVNIATG